MTDQATLKCSMEGPKWLRSDILVKDLCFSFNCEVVFLERDTTWLREHVRFKIAGSESDVRNVQHNLDATMADYNNPIDQMK